MYTTCRIYSNAKDLAQLIETNQNEVKGILQSVPGFNAYYFVETADGFMSITVCDDQAGAEESNKRAAEFVRSKGAGMSGSTPQIVAGTTAFNF